MSQGWFNEPVRHGLAARGVKTVVLSPRVGGFGARGERLCPSGEVEDGMFRVAGRTRGWLDKSFGADGERLERVRGALGGLLERGREAVSERVEERRLEKKARVIGEAEAKIATRSAEAEAEAKLAAAKKDVRATKTAVKKAGADVRRKKKGKEWLPETRVAEDTVPAPSAAVRDVKASEHMRYMTGEEVDVDAVANIVDNKVRMGDLAHNMVADARALKAYAGRLSREYKIIDSKVAANLRDERGLAERNFKRTWSGVGLKEPSIKVAYNKARREMGEEFALKREALRGDVEQHKIDVEAVLGKAKDFHSVAVGVRNRAMIG